jgi:hypothetical protein
MNMKHTKHIAIVLLLAARIAHADTQFCLLSLRSYETGYLPHAQYKRCTRQVERLCRRYCKPGIAAAVCRACTDGAIGGIGPCGVPLPTVAECCAAHAPL